MPNPETAAEFASDLFSHLDSSGGDYSDILDELRKCDETAVSDIIESVETADTHLTKAFELLDEVILEAADYSGGHGRFTEDVENEVREVADHLDDAENAVESALEASQSLTEEEVADDFKFGVHTDPESALQYLYGDAKRMREYAFEMERNY